MDKDENLGWFKNNNNSATKVKLTYLLKLPDIKNGQKAGRNSLLLEIFAAWSTKKKN